MSESHTSVPRQEPPPHELPPHGRPPQELPRQEPPNQETPRQELPLQELRLAVTFTGGVSLAVWMGGVARELNLLTQVSRGGQGTFPPPDPLRDCYARLLGVLGVTVSLDVLSGTSAGGINAALLGLANVRQTDLEPLRDIWLAQGAISDLLRDPREQAPTSLLQGDGKLLGGLREALMHGELKGRPAAGNPAAEPDPTRVFITTTWLGGEPSRYTDDYGTVVRDVDHQGLFSFTAADLAVDETLPALALAARCSASFPGAFEPALVPAQHAVDAAHPAMGQFSNATRSQFAADGGLLANRPLGPALRAIYERPAAPEAEVRRVLAYVVPTVGTDPAPSPAASLADTPDLPGALAAELAAAMSQSITSDLAELQAHNERVRSAHSLRRHLARLGTAGIVTPQLHAEQAHCQAQTLVEPIVHELLRQVAGRGSGFGPGGVGQVVPELYAEGVPVAERRLSAERIAASRPAVEHARDSVLAMLRPAFLLRPTPEERAVISAAIAAVTAALPARSASSARDVVAAALATAPGDPWAAYRLALDGWLDAELALPDPEPCWQAVTGAAAAAVPTLRALVARTAAPSPLDAAGPESQGTRRRAAADLVSDLLVIFDCSVPHAGVADGAAAEPRQRLLDLFVAEGALLPQRRYAEQPVELVQMSADTRSLLDGRTLANQKLTGLQLHHFGAFYKRSWRANDWMWGRLDGAGWLVHLLLDPRRLLALADLDGDPARYREQLLSGLAELVGGPPPADVVTELEFLERPERPVQRSLPATSMWVATRFQHLIAAEELACVAREVIRDAAEGGAVTSGEAFVAAYRRAAGGGAHEFPAVPAPHVAALLAACRVSDETLASDRNTDRFARTATHAAAVGARIADDGRLPKSLKPLTSVVRHASLVASQALQSGPRGRTRLLVGGGLLVLGGLIATSELGVIGLLGLVLAAAGLVVLAVSAPQRRVLRGVVAVLAAALLAIAAAGWVPVARRPIFEWLRDSAVPYLEHHPRIWALVVVFLLLPPAVTAVDLARRLRRRRVPVPAGDYPDVSGLVPGQSSMATAATAPATPRRS